MQQLCLCANNLLTRTTIYAIIPHLTHKESKTVPHMVAESNHYIEDAPVDRLRLLEDRILCRVVKKKRREGRFIIAGQFEYAVKTSIGRVLCLGDEYEGPLEAGDYVIFQGWTGREFQSTDETLILLRPDNVLAVIDREAE